MKLLKRITCALLTVFLINASMSMPVQAAGEPLIVQLETTVNALDDQLDNYVQQRSTTFIDTSIDIAFSAEGMYVAIHTGMNLPGSYVGVKDIKIQKKTFWGWSTVATAEGGEAYNVSGCVAHLNYTGAEYGEIYRVTCTHYGYVDEYRELDHETLGFTCIY